MKAFEKWLKEDSIKSGYLYDQQKEEQREKGWRAALQEAQKQINEFNTNFVGDIENWIEEELES